MFTNRTEVAWPDLDSALGEYNYEVSQSKKDGYCFLTSLQECMLRDHCTAMSLEEIKNIIDSEIWENNYLYRKFYPGSTKEMMEALQNYLTNGVYSHNVVDIAVIAAANSIGVNICIFKCIQNKALLYFIAAKPRCTQDIYMKYNYEHYDAIVWKPVVEPQDVNIKAKWGLETSVLNGSINDPIDPITRQFLNAKGIYFTHHEQFVTPNSQLEPEIAQTNKVDEKSNQCPNDMLDVTKEKPEVEDLGTDSEAEFPFLPKGVVECNLSHEFGTESDTLPQPVTDKKENIPVPDKYQFEEEYSGFEDAVLNNSSAPETYDGLACTPNNSINDHEALPTNLPSSQEDVNCDGENLNSDSMSSVFSDSSATSTSRVKPRKHEKNSLDEERMSKVTVEHVESIPWDINGDKIYELPATEENYMKKYADGRWFTLKNSTRVGLNGFRKVGSCQGSFICIKPDCPKLTTENSVNTIDFKCVGSKAFECSSCGYLAKKVYCGCIKVVEFDKDRGTLKYYHQGLHICHLRPNVIERRKVLADLPLPITGSSKAKKYMQECFVYHIENDDVDAAFEVCDAVCEDDVVAEIKKIALCGLRWFKLNVSKCQKDVKCQIVKHLD